MYGKIQYPVRSSTPAGTVAPTSPSSTSDALELSTPRSGSQRTPFDPRFSPEHLNAASIQGLARGFLTRKKVVLPKHLEVEIGSILQDIMAEKMPKPKTQSSAAKGRDVFFDSDDDSLSINSQSEDPILPESSPAAAAASSSITPDIEQIKGVSLALAKQVTEFSLMGVRQGQRKRLETRDALLDAWVTRIGPNNFEIEIIGAKKGHGASTQVFETHLLTLELQASGPVKTRDQKALARFETRHGEKLQKALALLEKHFPVSKPDPDLRIAGRYTHLDRAVGGAIEARDILMLGSFENQLENLTLEQKMQVLQDVAKTLQKLHAAGIVHRDIKSTNILVSADHRGYLADIEGLRNYMQPEDPNDQLGTVGYIGRGPGFFGDIYALAVTTEHVLEGENAFEKGINLIQKEEDRWLSSMRENDTEKRLESSDVEVQQAVYRELAAKFPIYPVFLDALANQNPNLMNPELEKAESVQV